MTDIPQPLVDRMVALVRLIERDGLYKTDFVHVVGLSRAIAAELPAPVDLDLLMAREVAVDCIEAHSPISAVLISKGDGDAAQPVVVALAAIKRVRAEYAAAGNVIAS